MNQNICSIAGEKRNVHNEATYARYVASNLTITITEIPTIAQKHAGRGEVNGLKLFVSIVISQQKFFRLSQNGKEENIAPKNVTASIKGNF
jgi:hypothetical protein